MNTIRIVVVGDEVAGKKELLSTYVTKTYRGYNNKDDSFSGSFQHNNSIVTVESWNNIKTEGLPPNYFDHGVFLIAFSVAHPQSFQNIILKWIMEVMNHYSVVPIVIVGTKTEMRNKNNKNHITPAYASAFVQEINAVTYLECSAKKQIGFSELFGTAINIAETKVSNMINIVPLIEEKVAYACANNDMKTVISFIDFIDLPNVKRKDGSSLLDISVRNNNESIANLLALAGARLSPENLNYFKERYTDMRSILLIHGVKSANLNNLKLQVLPHSCISKLQELENINLNENLLSDSFASSRWKVVVLSLSNNLFTSFPLNLDFFPNLKNLNLSNNEIKELPSNIFTSSISSQLELDISFNKIEVLTPQIQKLKQINAFGNPLTNVVPAFSTSKEKILLYFEYDKVKDEALPWDRVKLMLLGQEEVGKTSLLQSLQKGKFDPELNISTNGVNIAKLIIIDTPENQFMKKRVEFDVFDFGGQVVFHSTHRFFITSHALYLVLYDVRKPETHQRVKYWLEQIGSYNDIEGTRPVVIVGTHSDLISKSSLSSIENEMKSLYPISSSRNRYQIQGHYCVGLSDENSVKELRKKIFQLGIGHPKISIGKVLLPRSMALLAWELDSISANQPYVELFKVLSSAAAMGIPENTAKELIGIVHNTGGIVWHNVPKLKEFIFETKWLADAMAGVVSYMSQHVASLTGGMINWGKLKQSLQIKFSNTEVHSTIISMLEFFEIIYKMKTSRGVTLQTQEVNTEIIHDEQMFFIPSLLNTFTEGEYLALRYWHQLNPKKVFIRRFYWEFYPSGFVPRLLLRLVHLRVTLLKCWCDAAIIMSRNGAECAFIRLSKNDKYKLEVNVKVCELSSYEVNEPLITELVYVVTRLHKDIYTQPQYGNIPLDHRIVVPNINKETSFEKCITTQMEGKPYMDIEGRQQRVDEIFPDVTAFKQIPDSALRIEYKLGEGGFGVVYKGVLQSVDEDGYTVGLDVAAKEMRLKDDPNVFYDFQHEVVIMSKLNHPNLVRLYGITVNPLQMVLEYVEKSDLHRVLISHSHMLSFSPNKAPPSHVSGAVSVKLKRI